MRGDVQEPKSVSVERLRFLVVVLKTDSLILVDRWT